MKFTDTVLNNDYIYTLPLFIFEPISWINRYDWRQLNKREINVSSSVVQYGKRSETKTIFRQYFVVGMMLLLQ